MSGLRVVLVLGVLAIPSVASANPRLHPMTEVASIEEACTRLRVDIDPKAACKTLAKVEVRGLGTAIALGAGTTGIVRYAIVIETGGKRFVAEPTSLATANCGMHQCDVLDLETPRLRALATPTPHVALEIPLRARHEVTDDSSARAVTKVTARWAEYHLAVCGVHDGAATCTAQSWGSRENSCRNTLASTGVLTSTCTTKTTVGVDP